MRIGLIQTEVAAADFSVNLRSAVQSARACIDAGAELLVAPAQVLDGAFLGGLSTRTSFLLQASAALQALSNELSVPMLLASYAAKPGESQILPSPYLIGRGKVRQLKTRHTIRLSGKRLTVHVGASPSFDFSTADICVYLPVQPWDMDMLRNDLTCAETLCQHNSAALVLRSVSWSDGCVLGGASYVAVHGGVCCRLPLFHAGYAVWDSCSASTLPEQEMTGPLQLWEAARFAVVQAVRQGRYRGAAVDEAAPRAQLVRVLAGSALGTRRVHTLRASPGKYGRVRCAELQDAAWNRELLLLSTASREDILCGAEKLFAGELAPFGDMYMSEVANMFKCAGLDGKGTLPTARELALRALVDENRSLAELVHRGQMDETFLRALVRSLARTSSLRHTITQPVVLRTRSSAPTLPRFHRLME